MYEMGGWGGIQLLSKIGGRNFSHSGGVKLKLVAIWFYGNQSMAKGASEDRLAFLLICWRRTPGSPETACWQRWMIELAGERAPWGDRLRST